MEKVLWRNGKGERRFYGINRSDANPVRVSITTAAVVVITLH